MTNFFRKVFVGFCGFALLTAFSQAPAKANSATVLTVNGLIVAGATSSATPASILVPSDNSVDETDAVKVSITGLAQSTAVTVAGSGTLIVNSISTPALPVTAVSGVASATLNSGLSTSVEFYVYTTKAGLSSFRVEVGGSTNTYFIMGKSGPAYNVSSNVAKSAYTSTIYYDGIEVKVTDVFGNPVGNAQVNYSAIGLTIVSCNCVTDSNGIATATVNFPKIAGQAALSFSVVADSIRGLAAPKNLESNFITVIDVDAEHALELMESEKKLSDAIELHKSELDQVRAEGVAQVAQVTATLDAERKAHEATKAALAAAKIDSEALAAALDAARQAKSAADATGLQIEKLSTQVSSLLAAMKTQINTLSNTVAKIAKKVKA